jgi:hypothetical protein
MTSSSECQQTKQQQLDASSCCNASSFSFEIQTPFTRSEQTSTKYSHEKSKQAPFSNSSSKYELSNNSSSKYELSNNSSSKYELSNNSSSKYELSSNSSSKYELSSNSSYLVRGHWYGHTDEKLFDTYPQAVHFAKSECEKYKTNLEMENKEKVIRLTVSLSAVGITLGEIKQSDRMLREYPEMRDLTIKWKTYDACPTRQFEIEDGTGFFVASWEICQPKWSRYSMKDESKRLSKYDVYGMFTPRLEDKPFILMIKRPWGRYNYDTKKVDSFHIEVNTNSMSDKELINLCMKEKIPIDPKYEIKLPYCDTNSHVAVSSIENSDSSCSVETKFLVTRPPTPESFYFRNGDRSPDSVTPNQSRRNSRSEIASADLVIPNQSRRNSRTEITSTNIPSSENELLKEKKAARCCKQISPSNSLRDRGFDKEEKTVTNVTVFEGWASELRSQRSSSAKEIDMKVIDEYLRPFRSDSFEDIYISRYTFTLNRPSEVDEKIRLYKFFHMNHLLLCQNLHDQLEIQNRLLIDDGSPSFSVMLAQEKLKNIFLD